MNKKGTLVLFSGPSGVGKDTVLEVVLNKNKELQKSISLTTRKIREKGAGKIFAISFFCTVKAWCRNAF